MVMDYVTRQPSFLGQSHSSLERIGPIGKLRAPFPFLFIEGVGCCRDQPWIRTLRRTQACATARSQGAPRDLKGTYAWTFLATLDAGGLSWLGTW